MTVRMHVKEAGTKKQLFDMIWSDDLPAAGTVIEVPDWYCDVLMSTTYYTVSEIQGKDTVFVMRGWHRGAVPAMERIAGLIAR